MYGKKPEERFQEFKEWVVNNKLPSMFSNDPIEKFLAKWMHKNKNKIPEVQEIWNKFEHPKKPEERLLELKEFIKKHNRLPSNQCSNDPTEKSLYSWIYRNKDKIPEVQEIWNKFEHSKKREDKLPKLKEFIKIHNRLPSKYSKDPIEKSLRHWMSNNRNWDILKQFIAIFKYKEEYPELWNLEISEA